LTEATSPIQTPTGSTAPAPSAGPVSLEDVRQALGDTDPNTTNAGALRKQLGRGSVSTIQRHLDALRAQAAPPLDPSMGDVPKAPVELVQSLWSMAWAQAQAQVQGALALALAKTEGLAKALSVAQADALAAQTDADQAVESLETVQAQLTQLKAQYQDELKTTQQTLGKEASEARASAAQAQHALEVATARYDADLALLRGELDRQVSQLADLRAALQQRPLMTETFPTPPVTPT